MSDYAMAWLVYLLAVLGLLLVAGRLLRALRRLRWPVLLFLAGFLLTPVLIPEQAAWYAPAVVVAGVRLLDYGVAAMAALLLRPVQMGLLLAGLGLLVLLLRWLWQRRQATRHSDSPMTMDDSHEV